ncbi:hypothetical protein CVO74_17620 [Xanthomonas prunicola]|uniref:Uncharacterized protein n=1 Tax=Xanthomonas prunicola TaxID=2053930 RepID=A0A2N3REI9_9XANT|nr:hypothetical protein XpruCFBP8353_21075 [Xanthomonas prunicola]PKV19936.1 hypothetical protein CVO74_17620 [Xanthomonas prunicola]
MGAAYRGRGSYTIACTAELRSKRRAKAVVRRGRDALTARGTRRESVSGGSLAASMPPRVPQSARTPHQGVGR